MTYLIVSAILPILVLCFYIYKKDVNKEPKTLLIKIFVLGFFSAIPVLLCEIFLGYFITGHDSKYFIIIFLNTFISVALVEEGFKWLITRLVGYSNKEFDEIYDIIVYSVFASLGFACIENILYVLKNGMGNAILRAFVSIPGHMCFGVVMGYFFAQAKIGKINGNKSVFRRNIIFSLLVPVTMHTLYDTLIFHFVNSDKILSIILFFAFYVAMLILCFRTVNKISKIQRNITNTIRIGTIIPTEDGQLIYKSPYKNSKINYCPLCGTDVRGDNYCSHCGFKIK